MELLESVGPRPRQERSGGHWPDMAFGEVGTVAVSWATIMVLALRLPFPSKGRSSELPDVERPALLEFEPENRFPACIGSSSAA